jgi:hypothetical protein
LEALNLLLAAARGEASPWNGGGIASM